ncbi:hypothetical protein [Microbacterium sp. G2-8]|nr:hypothetical protein [Microbacterium sp. G2-8]
MSICRCEVHDNARVIVASITVGADAPPLGVEPFIARCCHEVLS